MGTQQLLRFAARRTTQWYLDLDRVSLRNAMAASTALAQRRLEHLEVEEFLSRHRRPDPLRAATMRHPVRRIG